MRNIRKVVAAVGVAVVASLTVSSVALAESINGSKAQPSHRTSLQMLKLHLTLLTQATQLPTRTQVQDLEPARSRSKLQLQLPELTMQVRTRQFHHQMQHRSTGHMFRTSVAQLHWDIVSTNSRVQHCH
jgi:hypothetical protein